MKTNLETTTVNDIAYLINTSCLRAECGTPLEKLADMLSVSNRYKVYLEDQNHQLCGVIQAKQIAMKILEFSRNNEDEQEMLPAIAYMLNSHCAEEFAESPGTVRSDTHLKQVLELMEQNHIREIAVVDADQHLVGTLDAKNILSHYLHTKAKASL